jgi:hypothetical protein
LSNESINLGDVIPVIDDMRSKGVIERYAIGGAFAAIIHRSLLLILKRFSIDST